MVQGRWRQDGELLYGGGGLWRFATGLFGVLLNYEDWKANKNAYIQAIHAGLGGDYAPMAERVRLAAGI
jgi:hypothetical protein